MDHALVHTSRTHTQYHYTPPNSLYMYISDEHNLHTFTPSPPHTPSPTHNLVDGLVEAVVLAEDEQHCEEHVDVMATGVPTRVQLL